MDPNDPTVVAERELLGAANKIEAAARKLSQLQAHKLPKVCFTRCSLRMLLVTMTMSFLFRNNGE